MRSKDKDAYNVCWRLLNKNLSDSDIKSIALFYQLKHFYRNSKVYDYSPSKLAQKIDLSAYLISKYIKNLIDKKLAWYTYQYDRKTSTQIRVLNLQGLSKIYKQSQDEVKAVGYKKTPKLHKHKIEIHANETIKEIVFRLKAVLIEVYYTQQQHVRKCKVDRNVLEENPKAYITLGKLKHIKRIIKNSDGELSREIVLSSRKAYSRFNINPYDFKQFRDFMYNSCRWYWKPHRKIKEACDILAHEYMITETTSLKYGYRYWKDGVSVEILPTALYIPYLERENLSGGR